MNKKVLVMSISSMLFSTMVLNNNMAVQVKGESLQKSSVSTGKKTQLKSSVGEKIKDFPTPDTTQRSVSQVSRDATIVNSFEELKSALSEDNGIIDITLGSDIILANGIAVNPAKNSISLDGAGYSLIEQNQEDNGTIYIDDNTGTKNVDIKNVSIQGKNSEGPVFVADNVQGVTINFDNLIYDGPQLVHNIHGFTTFSGTNDIEISVAGVNSDGGEEFVESLGVDIQGTFNLTHESLNSPAILFGTGNNSRPYLMIRDNADVTLEVLSDSLFYVDNSDDYPLDITVGEKARLSVKTQNGLFKSGHAGHVDFLDSSETTISREGTSEGATLNLDDSILKAEKNSKFNIIHFEETESPIISAVNSVILFDNAKGVELKGSPKAKVFNAEETILEIDTNLLESWHGNDDAAPDFQTQAPLSTQIKFNQGSVDLITSNLPDLLNKWDVLNTNHLILNGFEETIESPSLNPINDQDTQLTGTGIPGDTIIITADGVEIGQAIVGGDGKWVFVLDNGPLTAGTAVDAKQTDGTLTSEAVEQIVSHLVSETTNSFNLGYWQDYGIVIEGQMDNADWDLATSASITKTMKLVSNDENVALTIPMANTNWYGDINKYNGFQAILSNENLTNLAEGTYKVQLETKGSNFDETQDMNSVNSTTKDTGPFHDKFGEIESKTINGKTVSTVVQNNLCYIIVANAVG